MGCVNSAMGGARTSAPAAPVSRSAFYNGHPGLHNKPSERIESTVSTRVRAPDPNDNVTIKVQKVDLNVVTNTRAHFTNDYDVTLDKKLLVIRRGQSFEMDIEFNREYNRAKDDLRIVFRFGKNPSPTKRSHAEFILSDNEIAGEWGAIFKSKEGNSIKINVVSPPDCFVGKWSLAIDVVKRFDNEVSVDRYNHPDKVYILFNPWCKGDAVYMEDSDNLQEYILNETGKIYSGSSRRIAAKPWAFGQFEDVILDCVVYLLDEMSGIAESSRGNPVVIVRKISALVNSPDDGGVLTGNWSGEYDNGTPPLDWVGSVAILEEFYKTKKPVKYGQCWVFSGVVTTVCRALGIPARSVTNFVSAHDTDGSITIDAHFGEDKKPLKEYDEDSVWNFHVWNEVWMARNDLPPGYGGWQVIDSTPQETSAGLYCCGPTSVHAIKNGDVNLPYDGPFVFAEVNADRLLWMITDKMSLELVKKQKYILGKYISTKKINSTDEDHREDITGQYKYKEGSEEERAAVRRAHVHSELFGLYETGPEDVKFELSTNPDTFVGDNIVIQLRMINNSSEERRIDGRIVVSTMYYTGVHHNDILDHEVKAETLQPNAESTVPLTISETNYCSSLMDHCMLKISSLCLVKETNQTFCELEELRLRKPHLTLQAPDRGNVGKQVDVEVTFTNPLSVPLTGCELRIEGPGLRKPLVQKYGVVGAKQNFTAKFDLTPVKTGKKEVLVSFNCQQIRNVNGSHEIIIE